MRLLDHGEQCCQISSLSMSTLRGETGDNGMGRIMKLISVLAFASLTTVACGKRGALEAPGASENGPAVEQRSTGKSVATKEGNGDNRSFILDGLIK